jgi:hypothetical protein
MNPWRVSVAVLLGVAHAVPASAQAASGDMSAADAAFRAFLPTWEAAVTRMINGDTTLFMANASHADDVSLLSPYGHVVKGWAEVSKRYRLAAARMAPNSGGTVAFEYVAVDVQDGLAYIVVIERSDFMFEGDTAMQKGITRATEAFRLEHGHWKLKHRHMDHLAEQLAPPPEGKP